MGQKVEPSIAVVVVAYQSDTDIARCVASLEAARQRTPHLSLWVVDNSLDLDIRKKIKSHLKENWTHYQYFGENVGFAVGNNLGLKAAAPDKPDYFFLLNADAVVAPDSLANLLDEAERYPAAAYGPLMTYGDGTVYYAGGFISRWLGAAFHPGRLKSPPSSQVARDVSFLNGCGIFMPRRTYERWGGLPEEYFMYYEETAWCAQIGSEGGVLRYVPTARLTHYTPKETGKSATALYYLTRNQWLFARQHCAWYHKITAYPAIAFFQSLRFLKLIGNTAARQAIIHGWRDAYSHRYGKMA